MDDAECARATSFCVSYCAAITPRKEPLFAYCFVSAKAVRRGSIIATALRAEVTNAALPAYQEKGVFSDRPRNGGSLF